MNFAPLKENSIQTNISMLQLICFCLNTLFWVSFPSILENENKSFLISLPPSKRNFPFNVLRVWFKECMINNILHIQQYPRAGSGIFLEPSMLNYEKWIWIDM
jgi:hypothetical protein